MFLVVLCDTARCFYDAAQFGNPKLHTNSIGYDINQTFTLLFLGLYFIDLFIHVYSCEDILKSKSVFLDIMTISIYIIVLVAEYSLPDYEQITVLRILRGLRIIHAFKVVPLMPSLQVVVEALVNTMRSNIVDALVILFLGLYIMGMICHYLFSKSMGWSTFMDSVMTILVFVYSDGWRVYHDSLLSHGYLEAYIVSPILIIIGNFIIHK